MHGGPKSIFWPYYPGGISTTDSAQRYTQRAHNAQYFRAGIRKSHPPTMYLDDAILGAGLEDYPQFLSHGPETPQLSPQYEGDCSCCWTPDISMLEEEELDDGMISPLELPPRLLNFEAGDRGESTPKLLASEPKLDLKELDRRLESIARIKRLGQAGFLHAFFVLADAARI